MATKEKLREVMWGRFIDADEGEAQITTNEQDGFESIPVEVGIETPKFPGQKFRGTLALASPDGGFEMSGGFDNIPENRKEGVELDPQGAPEVVVFEDVDVPLGTPDSRVQVLFDGGVEGYAVLAEATAKELRALDEREMEPEVQSALNEVRTRVTRVESRVSALENGAQNNTPRRPVDEVRATDDSGQEVAFRVVSQFVAGITDEILDQT